MEPLSSLVAGLAGTLADPDRITTQAIDRVAYASDASHFLKTPRAVITAASAEEVAGALAHASRVGAPVTFRSGGTSLSGQGTSDSIIIDTRKFFREIEVLEHGAHVRVQPGATVRQVNIRLLRHGTRLGPDPASEAACTIGGVVANNSSGMACGTVANTYRTLESMVFVLPSGTTVNTADPGANAHLLSEEPELVAGLERLKRRVRENPASVAKIERQFSMKNTMGYGINAFLDFESPVDLLAHLIIGSEGTLAFVAEATFRTVPIHKEISTSLAVFPSLDEATRVLPELVRTGAATLELMDSTSIRVGQSLPTPPTEIMGIHDAQAAALLIEYHADADSELAAGVAQGSELLAEARLLAPADFSRDPVRRNTAWAFRKGLYASIAGARTSGTTALLEDIVVPVPVLSDTCAQLQELFSAHGYADSVIFGHAKDGNIHFMITDRFEGDAALTRYSEFTENMVDLVLAAGGNLKAEHGTGIVMAPYVRRQYGDELTEVMRELKRLCDPRGILNPGVIINDDPGAHLRDIKLADTVEEEVDRCVECGYCEPVCPSRDLTLTPRQRIVVKRAMVHAEKSGDTALLRELERDYDYEVVDTCAVDGMCGTVCPVQINTGDLVRRLRREQQHTALAAGWNTAAKHWGAVTRAGAAALSTATRLPTPVVRGATHVGRALLGHDTVPEYTQELPSGGPARRTLTPRIGAPGAIPLGIYLPACVNSMFGPVDADGIGVSAAFTRLVERAGIGLVVPKDIESLCCSTPWSSKGYPGGQQTMFERAARLIARHQTDGPVLVVSDASSCTEGFAKLLEPLRSEFEFVVEDAVAFTAREILPRIEVPAPTVGHLVLHPTCSSQQIGLNPDLLRVAEVVAEQVTVPDAWACCGYAGDRGMLHPELTDSATAAESAEVASLCGDAFASCNRTCELGMTRATGEDYEHVLELLERATR